jgi:hypothetical protein
MGLLIAWQVLELIPHVTDSVSYLFQGRILASGRLYEPPPPLPALFAHENVISTASRWCSKYPPGWPLLLALGWRLHAPWLLSPLLLGLAVVGIWLAGRRLYDPATGLLAAAALACSPFALLMAGDAMSHVPALCATAWCLAMLARISHTPSAAPPESGLSPALRSVGLPRRTSSTPRASDLRAPWIQATLQRLATSARERCGLAGSVQAAGGAWAAARDCGGAGKAQGAGKEGESGAAAEAGAVRDGRTGWAGDGAATCLGAGLLGGVALLIRPLTAVALLAPAAVWCAVALARRRRLAGLAWMALGAAPAPLALAAYNAAVFGGALVSGYAVYEPERYAHAGAGAMAAWPAALLHTLPWYLRHLDHSLWGLPWGDLLILLPLLWARPRRAADAMLAACAACLVLAHCFYYYGDVIYSGPRYAFEGLGPLALLAARSLRTLHGWLAAALGRAARLSREARRALLLALSGAAVCLLLYFPLGRRLPAQIVHHSQWYLAQSAVPLRAAARAGVGPDALVFVAGTPWCYSTFFLANDLHPQAGRRVFVRDIPPLRAAALQAYARPEVWVARVVVEIPDPAANPDVAKPTELSWQRLR